MAFSLRKMLSNINYFSKSGDEIISENEVANEAKSNKQHHPRESTVEPSENISFERTEPDSTSKHAASLKLPESLKKFVAKKGSLSDTDVLNTSSDAIKKDKRKKLKLDIKKASQSMNESIDFDDDSSNNVENTPKHMLLACKSSEAFSERFKKFDFENSFDISDELSDSSLEEENFEIDSLSEQSDSDISILSSDEKIVKMCRKVEPIGEENILVPSVTPESFGDIEIDRDEEERLAIIQNYEDKFEKTEFFLRKLLTEFQYHIEVSKVFSGKSFVTSVPESDLSYIQKTGDVKYMDNINRGVSPSGSWNVILEKEDDAAKIRLKNQLITMKTALDKFVETYLEKPQKSKLKRGSTYDITHKKSHMSYKKKAKHFDFPDYREAMLNLFCESDYDLSVSGNNITNLMSDFDDSKESKCSCRCHCETLSQTDSGLTAKSDSDSNQSITSSIGNFSLDSPTLTAFSESLDQIVSYNSFQDSSLYNSLLQKTAMERITFYVQVHSIQLKCEPAEQDFESKNIILFHCPSCDITIDEENELLMHILSQDHCEKIHFLYKTVYIKKCVAAGVEIQPSTVLNPMTMYRDDNKIVCFGDAKYACSLCFENLIVGESVLMAHCASEDHIDRREKMYELYD